MDSTSRRIHALEAPSDPCQLAEWLAGEMSEAWKTGQRPSAEDYFVRYPELTGTPEAATRLIYEEICLLEGMGQSSSWSELIGRFPQWSEALGLLRDCHEMVHEPPSLPPRPEIGEFLGDYKIHSLLGQGQRGYVFLTTQNSLAERPVVLKLTRRNPGCQEHIALARLQHPHIIPLYAVHDLPERDLRMLCMPYLGGATLDHVRDSLKEIPPAHRTGADLLRVLDASRTNLINFPGWSNTRQFLAGATYPRALCWIGACVAEALHAAHSRGLLHLDLKPSNVLITDDGQPMLLDFHHARGPIAPGDPGPERLGGTYGYMAPEQEAAMDAVLQGRPLPSAIDARSDIFALGVTLFEALTGVYPTGSNLSISSLRWANPKIDPGLAGIVARCLSVDPENRFPTAAALAGELRRLLGYHPLQGEARTGTARRALRFLHALKRPWLGPLFPSR